MEIRKLAKKIIDSCYDIAKDNGDNFATTYLDIFLSDDDYENFKDYDLLTKEIKKGVVIDCEVFTGGRVDVVFNFKGAKHEKN